MASLLCIIIHTQSLPSFYVLFLIQTGSLLLNRSLHASSICYTSLFLAINGHIIVYSLVACPSGCESYDWISVNRNTQTTFLTITLFCRDCTEWHSNTLKLSEKHLFSLLLLKCICWVAVTCWDLFFFWCVLLRLMVKKRQPLLNKYTVTFDHASIGVKVLLICFACYLDARGK